MRHQQRRLLTDSEISRGPAPRASGSSGVTPRVSGDKRGFSPGSGKRPAGSFISKLGRDAVGAFRIEMGTSPVRRACYGDAARLRRHLLTRALSWVAYETLESLFYPRAILFNPVLILLVGSCLESRSLLVEVAHPKQVLVHRVGEQHL